MCWGVEGKRKGGRGIDFTYSGDLEDRLVVKMGGDGVGGWGGERVCVEDWEGLEGGRGYWIGVRGETELWGTVGRGGVMVYVQKGKTKKRGEISVEDEREETVESLVGRGERGRQLRQEETQQEKACGLWESDPSELYGILTYPSGLVYWGDSLRDEGVTILLKGLGGRENGCEGEEISREIIAAGNVSWEFVGAEGQPWEGVDLNVNSEGTRLYLPSTLLLNNFPPSVWVEIEATFEWGEEREESLSANFSFMFLPGGVEFVLKEDPGLVIEQGETLTLDFGPSLVEDEMRGLVEREGQEWEWLWDCVNPLTGKNCQYQSGEEVTLPGGKNSKFVAEGKFVVGEPLLFVVRAKVVLAGDGGVSKGKWSRVLNIVGEGGKKEEVLFSEWGCLSGSGGGQSGYNV